MSPTLVSSGNGAAGSAQSLLGTGMCAPTGSTQLSPSAVNGAGAGTGVANCNCSSVLDSHTHVTSGRSAASRLVDRDAAYRKALSIHSTSRVPARSRTRRSTRAACKLAVTGC